MGSNPKEWELVRGSGGVRVTGVLRTPVVEVVIYAIVEKLVPKK